MKHISRVCSVVVSAIVIVGFGFTMNYSFAADSTGESVSHGYASLRKRCDFMRGNECFDHWIPTEETCKGVGIWGTARQQQQCFAVYGVGSRG
ncbi:hypothetical protein [Alloscardovia macacae]|uniref:Uncharacterized protein n=1 Tax=Alloscardovia macacae TaxID=1160091 RepID=A0A261F5Z4_9BIFI|nr:hypothetical protein [Alloscardovia macacae]OZG54569.1 hypothetical protein ALMA_0516 [Alloscardovia macacae]